MAYTSAGVGSGASIGWWTGGDGGRCVEVGLSIEKRNDMIFEMLTVANWHSRFKKLEINKKTRKTLTEIPMAGPKVSRRHCNRMRHFFLALQLIMIPAYFVFSVGAVSFHGFEGLQKLKKCNQNPQIEWINVIESVPMNSLRIRFLLIRHISVKIFT